ncbi:MAG: hypothetical protein PF483_06110 [Halothiobacillus sp.]|jgi:hypothetical protein|nr:hypothetical protein [Halothiobacillus sp.]
MSNNIHELEWAISLVESSSDPLSVASALSVLSGLSSGQISLIIFLIKHLIDENLLDEEDVLPFSNAIEAFTDADMMEIHQAGETAADGISPTIIRPK